MEHPYVIPTFKCQRAYGSPNGPQIIQRLAKGQERTDFVGQYCHSRLHQPPRRTESRTCENHQSYMGGSSLKQDHSSSKTRCWVSQRGCRSSEQAFPIQYVQLVPSSSIVLSPRTNVGPSLIRSLRRCNEPFMPNVQQSVLRPPVGRGRRPSSTGLGTTQQLRQLPFPSYSKGAADHSKSTGGGYRNRSTLAGSAMVSDTTKTFSETTISHPKIQCDDVFGGTPRTIKKQEMENISLASVWKKKLIKCGWNEFSAELVPYSLASSTLSVYDKYINQLYSFCQGINSCFPPDQQSVVADFLCELASHSNRPKSVLNIAMSAINSLYKATDSINPCSDNIRSLCCALVKSHTHYARPRTNILPMQPFKDLFMSWKDNSEL